MEIGNIRSKQISAGPGDLKLQIVQCRPWQMDCFFASKLQQQWVPQWVQQIKLSFPKLERINTRHEFVARV